MGGGGAQCGCRIDLEPSFVAALDEGDQEPGAGRAGIAAIERLGDRVGVRRKIRGAESPECFAGAGIGACKAPHMEA